MSINNSNIDKWLFDYYEGNLSPDDIRKLEQFLKKNPEYYEDADAWKDSFVEEALPAFNPEFLVKEPQTSHRRKLAYAALLLLLLSGSSLYFLLPSDKAIQSPNVATTFKADDEKTPATGNVNALVKSAEVVSPNSTTGVVNEDENTGAIAVANSSLSFTPEIERVQQMAARYQAGNNSFNTVNNHYYTVVNQAPTLTSTNNHSSVENNGTLTAYQNTEHNTSVNTVSSHEENNNGFTQQNLPGITSNNPNSVNKINSSLTELKAFDMNSGYTEELNLTINNNETGTESTVVNPTGNENAGTLANDNTEDKTVTEPNKENKAGLTESKEKNNNLEDRPSDLNPDVLMAKAKKEEVNKSVEIEKEKKTDIPLPKGLGFTNRKQVTLLLGINNEFENNASFISQHHMIDAYMGTRFIYASPIERGFGQTLGASQYFRKAKTTMNIFGYHNKTGPIEQTGLNLQVATQFKIDRFQSIIPSLSVSANRYDFTSIPEINTVQPANYNMIPSYAAGLMTTTPTYYNYANTTKMNVSAGVLYHHKKFFAGLSLNGLLQPKFTYELNDRKYTSTSYASANFVAGTDFISKKYPELSLSPQINITVRNLEPDFAGGAMLRYKSWGMGAGLSVSGALNTYAGYSHRGFGLQYRFAYDKLDAPFKGVSGHYLTMHLNLKSFVKKQKPILDSEK